MTDAAGFGELAMLASLAGRVERQLLRALRLELAPHLAAADEADVWFSPLVESAGETGFVFKPSALPELQRRLADDPLRRLEPAWNLLFRLRTGAAYAEREALKYSTWLLVQEELTYWGVRGGPMREEDRQRIALLCAWVVNARSDEKLAEDAGMWLQSVRLRLPAASWTLPGAEEMRSAAINPSRSRLLFVRRVAEGVELSEQTLEPAHTISTSAPAGPIRVEVIPRGEGAGPPQAALVGRDVTLATTAAARVDLILSDGQSYALDLVGDRPVRVEASRFSLRTVLVRLGRGHINGVLLNANYVLTCGRGAVNWRAPDKVAIERASISAARYPARVFASSPLARLVPLPAPFGLQADDFALLRLDSPASDFGIAPPKVADPALPMLGREATAYVAHPGREKVSEPRLLRGEVVGIAEVGFVVDFHEYQPESGDAGAPVWLGDGALLGLIAADGHDLKTLVAPARPLESLIAGTPRRVLVVGSGTTEPLPENIWRQAEALGRALGRAGHVLICGGWPGVDHIVARSFAAAVGDDAALASRFVQLVESGSSPDFESSVKPIFVDADRWAQGMLSSADAIVALGGLGGTLTIGRMALADGRIVLPIPGTGGDAAKLHSLMRGEAGPGHFPDRRALQILEGVTASVEEAEAVAECILELLELSFDDAKLEVYRRTAAVVARLLAGPRGVAEANAVRTEIEEAAGAFVASDIDIDPRAISVALLPAGAPWLIRDFLRLDQHYGVPIAHKARATLLAALLSDARSADIFARMITSEPYKSHRGTNDWLALVGSDDALRQNFVAFETRIIEFESRRHTLSELRGLAAKFLAPVDMAAFNASYRELERAARRGPEYFDTDFVARLMINGEAADRVIAYVLFRLKPTADLLAMLPVALGFERREAFVRRETRPLWQLLECFEAALDDTALAQQLPPVLDLASTLLNELKQSSEVDPGRECTRLLNRIVTRLRRSEASERFASYSRFTGIREGRRRFAWCVFVDAPRSRLDRIAQIEYTLDKSFRTPVRVVVDATHGFALESEGWGEFTLRIRISYKSGANGSQTFRLMLKADNWPPGPAYAGPREEPASRLYTVLSDPRWRWRTEAALARDINVSRQTALAVLSDLARGGFVRKASRSNAKGEALWGATARIGAVATPAGPSAQTSFTASA